MLYEAINIPHAKTDFLLENAIKLLVLDPPFRIVTCKIISKMLTSIVNHSRENNIELNPVPFIPIMQEYKNNIGNLKKMFEFPKIATTIANNHFRVLIVMVQSHILVIC